MSNKQVGLQLGVSENTIRDHLRTLFRKYHADNRLDFILKVERAVRKDGSSKRSRKGKVKA